MVPHANCILLFRAQSFRNPKYFSCKNHKIYFLLECGWKWPYLYLFSNLQKWVIEKFWKFKLSLSLITKNVFRIFHIIATYIDQKEDMFFCFVRLTSQNIQRCLYVSPLFLKSIPSTLIIISSDFLGLGGFVTSANSKYILVFRIIFKPIVWIYIILRVELTTILVDSKTVQSDDCVDFCVNLEWITARLKCKVRSRGFYYFFEFFIVSVGSRVRKGGGVSES